MRQLHCLRTLLWFWQRHLSPLYISHLWQWICCADVILAAVFMYQQGRDLHPYRHARAVCWVSSHTIQQIFLTVHCKSLLCLCVMKSQHSLEKFYHTILCKATDAIKSRLPCNEVHSCHNAKALNKWPMLQEDIVISCSVTAKWCTTVGSGLNTWPCYSVYFDAIATK